MKNATQPVALSTLFFTEMWERFSYYGMRAILTLYMVHQLGFSDTHAFLIYGSYTAFVYLTNILGGYLADRLLGHYHAVKLGGLLIMCGHLTLALPWHISFTLGLALVTVGTGFFKPNISVLVGHLYSPDDPRRDGGFTIFYLGINLGALLASISIGMIATSINWHVGFGTAALGMLLGLICFCRNKQLNDNRNLKTTSKAQNGLLALLIGLGTLGISYFIAHPIQTGYLIATVLLMTLVLISIWLARSDQDIRRRVIGILLFTCLFAIFSALFEQHGSSLILYVDRFVNRDVMGYTLPSAMFQGANALCILIFALPVAKLWQIGHQRRFFPGVTGKYFIGMALTAWAFDIIARNAHIALQTEQAAPLTMLLGGIAILTLAELCLSPVGLSLVTRLAPPGKSGQMMGVWFLGSACANYMAGWLATLTRLPQQAKDHGAHSAFSYYDAFANMTYLAIFASITILFLSPFLRHCSR